MMSARGLRSPQVAALIALAISLIAILLVPTSFSLGPGTTYTADSSITVFRNATIVTMVFYGLSFLSRWLVLPGMLTAVFGSLAMATYLLGPGRSSALQLGIAIVGLVVAFGMGFSILRRRRSAPA